MQEQFKYQFRSRTLNMIKEAKATEIDISDGNTNESFLDSSSDEYIPPSVSSIDSDEIFAPLRSPEPSETPNLNLFDDESLNCMDLNFQDGANEITENSDSLSTPIIYTSLQPVPFQFEEEDVLKDKTAAKPNKSTMPTTIRKLKNKSNRRKHNCIFCDVFVNNFARHLVRQHSEEIEVQTMLKLNKRDPLRKQLINKMRKEGDFCSGSSIPVQNRNSIIVNNLLPCIHCKGYYNRSTLRRHVKRCHFNNSDRSRPARHQSQAQSLMANHFGPRDPLRTSGVLDALRADEAALVAKKDKIICEVGRKYVKSHKEKHLIVVAKRHMRRLARLLIECRKLENDKNLTLLSLLHPSNFRVIITATRTIAHYNSSTNSFGSPSLALQMGTLLKKAIGAAYSLEIQRDVNSDKLNILNKMKTLIDEEWAVEASTEASQNLQINRFNKPTLIPMAEDIGKMKTYLENLINTSKARLQDNEKDEKAFKDLTEATYCSLLLFNKRRVGELQRIPLEIYLKFHNYQSSKEFEKLLTPSEKILINSLKRIVIRGKRGRGVPVLFDKLTKDGVDMMIEKRNNFFENMNRYLFGLCGTTVCISGYHVLRKHVSIALGDASKSACLTSTKLRKHLATISQILKMGTEELDQLAAFMGHTSKTHNEFYRLPSDIYQTAKVSKILLLAQNNCIDEYKGRSLAEINIDNEILEAQSDSDNEEAETDITDLPGNNGVSPGKENIPNKNITKKKKRTLLKWSMEERKVTEDFFKKHIKEKIPPKKAEILQLIEKYPKLFGNRKWNVIKVYVQNKYKRL